LATSGYVGLQAESDGLGTLSMTLSTFSGLELLEAEAPAFGSKKELIFLCIMWDKAAQFEFPFRYIDL
jgi:hypothetical protein